MGTSKTPAYHRSDGDIARLLREGVERLGVSQAEAARRCGLSRQRLHQLVNGMYEPRLSELRALVVGLGLASEEVAQVLVAHLGVSHES